MDRPYSKSAAVYDALYAGIIDHGAALRESVKPILAERAPHARTALEAACGTGLYLEQLAQDYEVEGFDLSDEMVALARERLPDAPIYQADMRDFDLGKQFDLVFCIFSSIAYMLSVDDLNAAVANMAHHLAPGGLLIVEPWFGPEGWSTGRMDVNTFEGDGFRGARVVTSHRDGNVAIMRWAYAVVDDQGGADAYVEEHPTGLFTHDQYLAAFIGAGLEADHDPEGPIGRGLYIAQRAGG